MKHDRATRSRSGRTGPRNTGLVYPYMDFVRISPYGSSRTFTDPVQYDDLAGTCIACVEDITVPEEKVRKQIPRVRKRCSQIAAAGERRLENRRTMRRSRHHAPRTRSLRSSGHRSIGPRLFIVTCSLLWGPSKEQY